MVDTLSLASHILELPGAAEILNNLKEIGAFSILILCIIMVSILAIVFYIKDKVKSSLSKALGKYYKRADSETYNDMIPTVYVFDKMITYIAVIICFIVSVRFLGIKIGNFTLLIGGASVVIVLGLQEFLKNFVSGLIMLFEHNMRIGDILDISTVKAVPVGNSKLAWISEIRTRTTLLTTLDGREVVIPNKDMVNNPIINITLSTPIRRVYFPFFLPNSVNFEDIKKKILETIILHPVCLKQPVEPALWVRAIVPGYVYCDVVVWINQKRIKTSPVSLIGTIVLDVLSKNNALVKDVQNVYMPKLDDFSSYDSGF